MATFNQRLIRLERQMAEANKRITLGAGTHTITSGGSGGKFGLEDAVAAESRSFDTAGYSWSVQADSEDSIIQLDATNPTGREVYIQTAAPDGGGTYGYMQLISNDAGATYLDLWVQDDTGDIWTEVWLLTTELYLASTDIYAETINGYVVFEMYEDADPTQSYLTAYYDGGAYNEITLSENGIYIEVDPTKVINIVGVQAGTIQDSLGLDVDGHLVTGVAAVGDGGGATAIVAGSNGELFSPTPSGTFKESTIFRFTLDPDSVYYFKYVINFDGGSTDHQLATKFTVSDVGLLVNASLTMHASTVPAILVDNVSGFNGNFGVPIDWDLKSGYNNGGGNILTIEGTVSNTGITPVTFIFNWKVFEGYASAYVNIGQGSGGFYQKLGAYYVV